MLSSDIKRLKQLRRERKSEEAGGRHELGQSHAAGCAVEKKTKACRSSRSRTLSARTVSGQRTAFVSSTSRPSGNIPVEVEEGSAGFPEKANPGDCCCSCPVWISANPRIVAPRGMEDQSQARIQTVQ